MKRFNLHIGAFLTLALAVSSCAEEELMKGSFVPSPSSTITFGASDLQIEVLSRSEKSENAILSSTESKLVSEDGDLSLPMMVKVEEGIHRVGEAAPASRADKVDNISAISTLHAWATHKVGDASTLYFEGETGAGFTKNGEIFYADADEPYLWPEEGGKLDFVTVVNRPATNFTPNFNDQNQIVSFNYTVPAVAANQPDILVAKASEVSDGLGESVPLEFKHIMAAVNFEIGELSNNIQGTIKSIKLKGIYNQGTYQVDNHEWINRTVADGGEFIVPLNADGTANDVTLMMIPQQLFTGAEVEIVFVDKLAGEQTLRASIQGDVWGRSTTTSYLINIDGNYNIMLTPLDKTLDSHYIITKVEVNSVYDWELTANSNDGALVTVQLESDVNPMAKLGFWTDKNVAKNGDTYVIDENSTARGGKTCEGSGGSPQIVYVFIPENITGEDRLITLLCEDENGTRKELVLTQGTVKWLNSGSESWGCELLLEGGQVPWGFCWDDTYVNLYSSHGNWKEGEINNIPPGQVPTIEAALEGLGLDVEAMKGTDGFLQLQQEQKGYWFIRINLGKLGNITIAESVDNGWTNTNQLYHWEGIESLSTMLNSLSTWEGIDNPEAISEAGLENSLDYATLYAMKRNRFYYYYDNVSVDGTNMEFHLPVIFNEDINWYLPAKNQFLTFMQANWGQEFTWNDSYWTSTAYLEDAADNSQSYAYINGVETVAHRNDRYLTFALRNSDGVVIDPDDVIQPNGNQ